VAGVLAGGLGESVYASHILAFAVDYLLLHLLCIEQHSVDMVST